MSLTSLGMDGDRRRYKEGRGETAVPKGKDRRAGSNAAGLGREHRQTRDLGTVGSQRWSPDRERAQVKGRKSGWGGIKVFPALTIAPEFQLGLRRYKGVCVPVSTCWSLYVQDVPK